jgi:hypothetical protein
MLLYTYPENFRAYKALIAAQFSGAKVDVAPNFIFGDTNRTEAFLKKFPLGKVSPSAPNASRCTSSAIPSSTLGKIKIAKNKVMRERDGDMESATCAAMMMMTFALYFNKS